MRVFIGLTEVSGYYHNLKKGFDAIGVHAEYASIFGHPFQYDSNEKIHVFVRWCRYCVKKRIEASSKNRVFKYLWLEMLLLTRLLLFLWSIAKFDVFLLGGGSSFFRFAEFPILKLLGKRIVYTFHGTDCRPAFIDGIIEDQSLADLSAESRNSPLVTKYYIDSTKRRKANVDTIDRFADVIVNVPPQAHFHTRPYVHGLIIGLPFCCEAQWDQPPAEQDCNAARVLHCPSHRGGKGTSIIRDAVARLRQDGYALEYVEISGKPNSCVLEEIRRCDFVVDQLYSDNPMAGFAREAAFLGKPAVVAGYYSEVLKNDLPEKFIPPSLYCHPKDIKQAIERLVSDKNMRLRLGLLAKKYVEANWTAEKVAMRYMRLIEGDIPKEWLYSPHDVRYLHGCGLSEEQVRQNIRSVVELGGKEALQLRDKPSLEKMLIDFAYQSAERC